MIGSLRGKIVFKGLDRVELDTGGIGWEIFLSQNDLARLNLGDQSEIFIFHHLGQNSEHLFGFLDRKDKFVFEMLISVSGIGPKTAVAIFSAGSGDKIIKAVAEADVDFFLQIKGIGKKSAQRIIVDLKNKVGSVREIDLSREEGASEPVYQALSNLGFKRGEIREAIGQLPDEIISDEEKIRSVLKIMGSREQKSR